MSCRFAISRVNGDIADAATAAEAKALALVFVDDQGRNTVPSAPALSKLSANQTRLIKAVAAKNPNTVVILNTGTPIIVKGWIDDPNIKAVLNMWHAGQEGGTATARLLLGQANPSGHVTITWPKDDTDTIEGYNQPAGLYPGDTAGFHPGRLNGKGENPSVETQGIYSGYRYYDQAGSTGAISVRIRLVLHDVRILFLEVEDECRRYFDGRLRCQKYGASWRCCRTTGLRGAGT